MNNFKNKKFFSSLMAFVLSFTMTLVPMAMPQAFADEAAKQTEEKVITPPTEGIDSSDIVVLYDNDVHCAINGYENISALKKQMLEKTENVALVSNGDFIQGATIGALSQGNSIIQIMNQVGYDVVTLGNHEFDYKMPQLKKLMKDLKATVVSCNFVHAGTTKPVYQGYAFKKYKDKKVAFIGIATPESITKSTPAYFQDSKGKYIYDFCSDQTGKALYTQVQKYVDLAKKQGADYVVALAHLGTDGITDRWTSTSVIKNTNGIDVMLDGHSHSVIVEDKVKNKDGKEVVLSSTGTRFKNIGKLVIDKDGKMNTSLISLKDYKDKDPETTKLVEDITKKYEKEVSKVIGKSEVDLTTLDPKTGKRAVRNSETNLGDFCADALRAVMGTDVGIMNSGGIRDNIAKGDVTYNNLLSVFPWSNMVCTMEVTGKQIKDALELGAMNYPKESGGFLQVSGILYDINEKQPSTVQLDDKSMFIKVAGKYRVQNIKILNKKTQKYENLDLNKKYTLAGINYTLKSAGDGYTMFKGSKILKDETVVDNEVLITYLTKTLKGKVGMSYKNPHGKGRIKIIK